MATKKSPPNEIIAEGVKAFPENETVIKSKLSMRYPVTAAELLTLHSDRYHGNDKPGCILVKVRREKTYQDHYLDIYGCLLCGLDKECLRSGWEIGWYGGKHVSELSSKFKNAKIGLACTQCDKTTEGTIATLSSSLKQLYDMHEDEEECKHREKDSGSYFYKNFYWIKNE